MFFLSLFEIAYCQIGTRKMMSRKRQDVKNKKKYSGSSNPRPREPRFYSQQNSPLPLRRRKIKVDNSFAVLSIFPLIFTCVGLIFFWRKAISDHSPHCGANRIRCQRPPFVEADNFKKRKKKCILDRRWIRSRRLSGFRRGSHKS